MCSKNVWCCPCLPIRMEAAEMSALPHSRNFYRLTWFLGHYRRITWNLVTGYFIRKRGANSPFFIVLTSEHYHSSMCELLYPQKRINCNSITAKAFNSRYNVWRNNFSHHFHTNFRFFLLCHFYFIFPLIFSFSKYGKCDLVFKISNEKVSKQRWNLNCGANH